MSLSDDLQFISDLARAAALLVRKNYGKVQRLTKRHDEAVSEADRASQRLIVAALRKRFPGDGIIGEENETGDAITSDVPDPAGRNWVIDPIDGTKNYVRGVPVWATLIGLMDSDEVVVGVVSAPALGRRWWAARGGGAWTGRGLTKATRCRVSEVAKLEDASLSYSGVTGWEDSGRLAGFLGLARSVWRTRAFGDFWSHVLVAEGAVDISAEPEVTLWDLAALQVVVEEAGGIFTDLTGKARPDGGSAVCTNGLLHGEVLDRLAPE